MGEDKWKGETGEAREERVREGGGRDGGIEGGRRGGNSEVVRRGGAREGGGTSSGPHSRPCQPRPSPPLGWVGQGAGWGWRRRGRRDG